MSIQKSVRAKSAGTSCNFFSPNLRAVSKVSTEAVDRTTHKSIMRGWVKILTAAMAAVPSTPTMMMSTEESNTIKSPSKAAGMAMPK